LLECLQGTIHELSPPKMGAFPEIDAATIARYEQPGPRYTSYPTVPEWNPRFGPAEYAGKLSEAAREGASSPLSLYFHLPFCRHMCAFCGCNVVVTRDSTKADEYLTHLELELALAAERLGKRREISQLHLGGGTPTFLNESQLARLWRAICAHFSVRNDAELAVEVNPVVTNSRHLTLLRSFGFNRLSMGVQDFDREVQEAIERNQSFELTAGMVAEARRIGFRGINLDLVYGLPLQTQSKWERTLRRIVDIRPDRIAVYSFAYVPSLKPHQKRLPVEKLPRGEGKLSLFCSAYNAFVEAGYQAIGMDHFALPDDELSVAQDARTLWRNFQGYTIKAATDVIAFGITGISDVQGAYAQNIRPLPQYYRAISAGRFATVRGVLLSEDDCRRRSVITDLMCNFWVDLGPDGLNYFQPELDDLQQLEREGLLELHGSEVELTRLGRVFVRNVAMVFDAYLRRDENAPKPFSMTV
jgi:oxygen-independent coproporphyrinogen III oxidase